MCVWMAQREILPRFPPTLRLGCLQRGLSNGLLVLLLPTRFGVGAVRAQSGKQLRRSQTHRLGRELSFWLQEEDTLVDSVDAAQGPLRGGEAEVGLAAGEAFGLREAQRHLQGWLSLKAQPHPDRRPPPLEKQKRLPPPPWEAGQPYLVPEAVFNCEVRGVQQELSTGQNSVQEQAGEGGHVRPHG